MKYLRFIAAISTLQLWASLAMSACGPYYPENPVSIKIFRCCSPELERQWQEGCRFQDYEKEENCNLWQRITSASIPLADIEKVIYKTRLSTLKSQPGETLADNAFAQWLYKPEHREDLEYILVAKEIEELRDYMNNPWYYPYNGDKEHARLDELMQTCSRYNGTRHTSRYALQLTRLYFTKGDYQSCIDLWEKTVSRLPKDIVTEMTASYIGGAYTRCGNREKAIELFTRSQDIGSLISIKAWDDKETQSVYNDDRIKQLEYIFNRFPNSPLLSIKLQKHIRDLESYINDYREWKERGFHDPVPDAHASMGDSIVPMNQSAFYNELKKFANDAISSKKRCRQEGMWNYALSYLSYLEGNIDNAIAYLNRAEIYDNTSFITESIRALRFLINAASANIAYKNRATLLDDLRWLDRCMSRDIEKINDDYMSDNYMNYEFYYWQDVARKVILGELCPRLKKAGDNVLALQLANYASNRIIQLNNHNKIPYFVYDYTAYSSFDEYRNSTQVSNYFDYSNQFFKEIDKCKADDAAKYATTLSNPRNSLDAFLNERGYVDSDYICEIVGTLYLREMNYEKGVEWLSKVSQNYQARTNLAKEGYFTLDPFRFQFDRLCLIKDPSDYKMRFAQEMVRLEKLFSSDAEINRKAEAKILFATGLRNSFDRCWYITQYGRYTYYEYNEVDQEYHITKSNEIEGPGCRDQFIAALNRAKEVITAGLEELTDQEKAAQINLDLKNFATVMSKYPDTHAAEYIRTRCDNYYDYFSY